MGQVRLARSGVLESVTILQGGKRRRTLDNSTQPLVGVRYQIDIVLAHQLVYYAPQSVNFQVKWSDQRFFSPFLSSFLFQKLFYLFLFRSAALLFFPIYIYIYFDLFVRLSSPGAPCGEKFNKDVINREINILSFTIDQGRRRLAWPRRIQGTGRQKKESWPKRRRKSRRKKVKMKKRGGLLHLTLCVIYRKLHYEKVSASIMSSLSTPCTTSSILFSLG